MTPETGLGALGCWWCTVEHQLTPSLIHPWSLWPDGALDSNSGPTLLLLQERRGHCKLYSGCLVSPQTQGQPRMVSREPSKAQDLTIASSVDWAGGTILKLTAFSPDCPLQYLLFASLP